MDDPIGHEATYSFGPAFRRKLLALACRTDLLHLAPGCFQARFFGAKGSAAGRHPGPQEAIARCVEDVWASGNGRRERPSVETIEQLLAERLPLLAPEARPLVEGEWRAVKEIELPDAAYAAGKLRQWAQDEALEHAVVRAGEMLRQPGGSRRPEDRKAVRKLIDDALALGEQPLLRGAGYFADLPDRLRRWANVDEVLGKVPTGFRMLDAAMGGGAGLGEVVYFLAPPKGGKTHALLQCAMAASMAGVGVAWFSYEVKLNAMLMRMDRYVAVADKRAVRDDPRRVRDAAQGRRAFGAAEVWVEQFAARKQGCDEAHRIVERRRAEGHAIGLVVLDYLNIMSGQKSEQEKRHELTAISRDIGALGRELDVPIWSAALVNRAAVDKVTVRATDIGEAYEVISVLDGAVALCATKEERAMRPPRCRLFIAAMREDESELPCGVYERLADQMRWRLVSERWPDMKREQGGGV